MCGIVGYSGNKSCKDILISGLKKLEYRGYDSAGIAFVNNHELMVEKEVGKVASLEQLLSVNHEQFTTGIAHTRWATHGEPTTINAHPHLDCKNSIAVVHNGIIENYIALKKYLIKNNHTFQSDTDTEVFAHLIEQNYEGDFRNAVLLSLKEIEGSFAFAVIHKNHPNTIIAAKKGSPLILGIGESENYIASDVTAIAKYTSNIVYIDEEEVVEITGSSYSIVSFTNQTIDKTFNQIKINLDEIELNGYPHYMLKEIFEQPQTIQNAIRGRINIEEATTRLDGLDRNILDIRKASQFILSACGTSWHSSLIGEYFFEKFTQSPTEVEYASEMRYKDNVINKDTVSFFISQSGETADTIAALREAKRRGSLSLGICNVVNSTIARETEGGVYLHAGPEIGVASTKAFTSQVTVLLLISIFVGRLKNLSYEEALKYIKELNTIPEKIEKILHNASYIEQFARKIYKSPNALFLGRGVNYPVALEGALKLKEISYIHAEGYPAAEMKHGPIALIDENMPVFVIATKDFLYDKIMNNIKEVKSRKGKVFAIATENDTEIKNHVDHVFYVPETLSFLYPILNVIPLQLLAYYVAVFRGLDVDKPRNLAKSVTVE